MISETFFSTHYTSVWRSIAPSMEDFVRRTNLDGLDREWIPLKSTVDSDRRGLVNETAFILFADAHTQGSLSQQWLAANVASAFSAANSYIYGTQATEEFFEPSDLEIHEAFELCQRLFAYFRVERRGGIVVRPPFLGCGIISACNGDVLSEQSGLYEVKSGNRPFRSTDYRQLSVYLGLYYAQTRIIIPALHIVNPRTGICADIAVDDFTRAVSGKSAAAYCQSVIECFSANLVSE